VQADSAFPERFLTICTRRNLDVWKIRHLGEERLVMHMSLSTFKSIRQVCRRTRTHLSTLSRRGLPFLLHRFRKRKAALIGLLLTLIFLWYTSGHIMGITVFGNNRIPREEILTQLKACGISLGAPTKGIDASVIRNRIMQEMDELAWIGVNVNGSRIYVEIVERLEKEPGVDAQKPCHLVAIKDGIVESIEARQGQSMVKIGSGVREGDILVSGIVDNEARGFLYVHAYGDVFAKTTYSLSRDYPLVYDENVATGKHTARYTVSVFDLRVPLFWSTKAPYEQFIHEEKETEYRLPIERLPSLWIKKVSYQEQTTEHKTRSAHEALEQGITDLTEELKKSLPENAQIQDTQVSHTLTERNSLSLTVTLHCKENIAKELPIDNIVEFE
jgi:similar to stage IV sporulation protein